MKKNPSSPLTRPSVKQKDKNKNKKPAKYFKGDGKVDLAVWKSQKA